MNPKTNLHEFLQKNNIPLPIYNTNRIGGTDHRPLYSSTIILNKCLEIKGNAENNKKEAENSAAFNAYEYIKTKGLKNFNIKNVYDDVIYDDVSVKKNRYCLLIDMENLQKICEDVTDNELKFIDVYVFVGKHSHLVNKKLNDSIKKIISPSSMKNGTDTCIQVYVGSLLEKNMYDVYFISSRDSFAAVLAEIINSNDIGWKNKKGYQISKIEHIYDYV